MGRAITDQFLWNQITQNKKFRQLFEYLEKDKKACFEHRKDNKPVLYYDSKKMFVFEAMSQGGKRIRLSFPLYYRIKGSKEYEHIELDDIDDWKETIKRYSDIQSEHIMKVQESLGYKEDRWQFDLVNYFNYESLGANDFYVINTEYGQEGDNNRNFVDLVLLHGLKTGTPHIVLCELKYGDNSLKDHGINDHLSQYQGYLDNPEKLNRLVADMTRVFVQRCELGLIRVGSHESYSNLEIRPEDTTAMIVVREHKPRSERLNNEMLLVRENKKITQIKDRTKIFVYNEGCYDPRNPFNEDYCIEGFR